jgi:serine/threonine protein kinase
LDGPTPVTQSAEPTDQDLYAFPDPPRERGEIGRFGLYRVRKVLGVGGMGIIFEAEDPQLRRSLALKVLNPQRVRNQSHRERFLREARATAALEHDHIVAIHYVGEEQGVPFLAMPLLHGETLLNNPSTLSLPVYCPCIGNSPASSCFLDARCLCILKLLQCHGPVNVLRTLGECR